MSHFTGKLEPGGSAMIIGSVCPENIGRIVVTKSCITRTVQNFASKDETTFFRTQVWDVATPDGSKALCVPIAFGQVEWRSEGHCRAQWLMPIKPEEDFLTHQQTEGTVV